MDQTPNELWLSFKPLAKRTRAMRACASRRTSQDGWSKSVSAFRSRFPRSCRKSSRL